MMILWEEIRILKMPVFSIWVWLDSSPWKKSHPHLFRVLLKTLINNWLVQVYFTQTQFSSVQTYVHQQNHPACASPRGKEEAFNKTIKKQQYKSEVSEWSILFQLHQYPNWICLVPVFGSYGLLILNSIFVIPSLAIVPSYGQMSLWIGFTISPTNKSPFSPTNKCR